MDQEVNFELFKDALINVITDLDVGVVVDVLKDVDVTVNVDVVLNVEGNTAEVYLSNEAFGDNTYTQTDVVMWTTEHSSSIELYAISVTN
jgi:hypothetical protein